MCFQSEHLISHLYKLKKKCILRSVCYVFAWSSLLLFTQQVSHAFTRGRIYLSFTHEYLLSEQTLVHTLLSGSLRNTQFFIAVSRTSLFVLFEEITHVKIIDFDENVQTSDPILYLISNLAEKL